jgi:glycerol-3-phosphate O-acyltransferase/dihydroxyacetone phosphate acyltransferase
MISKDELGSIKSQRGRLENEVWKVAVERCLLPASSQEVLRNDQQQEIVIKNGKVTNSRFDYFSIRRRRKKDYNEVLRLWDLVDM